MAHLKDIAFDADVLRKEAAGLLSVVAASPPLDVARERLRARIDQIAFDVLRNRPDAPAYVRITVRDCARVLQAVLSRLSDDKVGFSMAQALVDVAARKPRPDLTRAFFAEVIHWVRGLNGRETLLLDEAPLDTEAKTGREAALVRSDELDRL